MFARRLSRGPLWLTTQQNVAHSHYLVLNTDTHMPGIVKMNTVSSGTAKTTQVLLGYHVTIMSTGAKYEVVVEGVRCVVGIFSLIIWLLHLISFHICIFLEVSIVSRFHTVF